VRRFIFISKTIPHEILRITHKTFAVRKTTLGLTKLSNSTLYYITPMIHTLWLSLEHR